MKRLVALSLLVSSAALAQPAEPTPEPAPPPEPTSPPPPPPTSPPPAPPTVMTPVPEPVPEPVTAPLVQSVLPNLFATSIGTTVEVRLDYSDLDGIDLTVLSAFAHVQHLTPQGFGGYVRIPFGYVEEDSSAMFDFGGSGIGNLEVGGLFVTKTSPHTDLLARAGVSIDTTAEDDDLAVTLSTVLPRLIDTYASGLQTTWARGQAQVRHAANNLRFGGGIGMDVPIAGDGADQDGFVGIIHAVAAIGLQQDKLGLGLSFVMVQPITDEDDENITGLNLGVDYAMNPNARLFFQIGLSLEDNADGTALGVGARTSF